MIKKELLYKGEKMLRDAGIEDARFDAMQIALFVSGKDSAAFLSSGEETVTDAEEKEYLSCIDRRIKREPLQYIIGSWDFYKSTFSVGPGVLIPRPETEELTDMCIKKVKENKYKVIYDLCAGSGAIGISIAKECKGADVYLFEFMDSAIYYTRKNAQESGLHNLHVIKCDVLEGINESGLPGPDLIVSNPPYIKTEDIKKLQTEVLKEPVSALDGGEDGLIFYRRIAEKWLPLLNENGYAAFECGEKQSEDIANLTGKYINAGRYYDMYGCDRFVAGIKI